jgi:hypothetical protein
VSANPVKKDLFAPEAKIIPRRRKKIKMSSIPYKLGWNKEHGSWAVNNGIIKVEE